MEGKVRIGGDPEMFAVDEYGMCVPPVVLEFLGLERVGTENILEPDKHPFYFDENGFRVMADGAALELTFPPATSQEELESNYYFAREKAREIVTRMGFYLAPVPSVNFSMEHLEKEYGVDINHPAFWMAVRFGCDPQFNIYAERFDQMIDAKTYPWRHAGGHVHVSVEGFNLHGKTGRDFVKLCDLSLGQVSIAETRARKLEEARQEFYGKPGNCRWQEYPGGVKGVEYRTPSITLWQEGIAHIFPLVQRVLARLENPDFASLGKAKRSIVSCDQELSKQLLNNFYAEK